MATFEQLILSFSCLNRSNALETADLFLEDHLKISKANKMIFGLIKKVLQKNTDNSIV